VKFSKAHGGEKRRPEKGKAPAVAGACPVSSSEPIQKKTTRNDPNSPAHSKLNGQRTAAQPESHPT
jgi:hypothetical protein